LRARWVEEEKERAARQKEIEDTKRDSSIKQATPEDRERWIAVKQRTLVEMAFFKVEIVGNGGNVRDTGNTHLFCVSPCSQDLFAEDNPAERLNRSAGVAPRMENFHPPSSTLDFGLGRTATFRTF
jgi:hypothetical protein